MLTNPTVCICSSEDSEGDQGCEDNASARQDREGLKCEGGCQKHQPRGRPRAKWGQAVGQTSAFKVYQKVFKT